MKRHAGRRGHRAGTCCEQQPAMHVVILVLRQNENFQ
jgi:hypothetical protein